MVVFLKTLFNQRIRLTTNVSVILKNIWGVKVMGQSPTKKGFFILDLICIIIIIGMTGYTFYSIMKMPETIPIHSTDGVVEGWGSRWISLLIPGLTIFIYVFFSFFSGYLKKRNQSIIIAKWAGFGCVILFSIVNVSFIQFALA